MYNPNPGNSQGGKVQINIYQGQFLSRESYSSPAGGKKTTKNRRGYAFQFHDSFKGKKERKGNIKNQKRKTKIPEEF